jgi:predicted DNA-binding protein YlxM (UPF0122 family)
MEFFAGAVTTTIILYLSMKYFEKLYSISEEPKRYNFTQSSLHEMIKPLLPQEIFKVENKKTQSYEYERKTNVRVIILDGMAYWIKDNKFYESEINEQGIDKEASRIVDTIGMDKVQLDKMLFIMDKLREGLSNDSGDSGEQ